MTRSAAVTPEDPDRPLVRRARQGDYQAFEQLVVRYERRMYTLAMRIVRNEADAEEVVQETFLSVLEHLGGFQEQSRFHTWLVRIATNHALKVLRKRRGLSMAPSGGDGEDLPHPDFIAPWETDPAKLLQQKETADLLDQAIEELDEKYRVVFLLRDVEGLSTEETAAAVGISVANTKVRLLRARLMLRERLARHFGDQDRRMVADHRHEP